jgi:hypothetical protein
MSRVVLPGRHIYEYLLLPDRRNEMVQCIHTSFPSLTANGLLINWINQILYSKSIFLNFSQYHSR